MCLRLLEGSRIDVVNASKLPHPTPGLGHDFRIRIFGLFVNVINAYLQDSFPIRRKYFFLLQSAHPKEGDRRG
jgi:hypothetical protein